MKPLFRRFQIGALARIIGHWSPSLKLTTDESLYSAGNGGIVSTDMAHESETIYPVLSLDRVRVTE